MEKGKLPENIKENVSLKDYSTFKIGGQARFFCACRNAEEAKNALDFAVENKLKVFVIGKGSNLLISDSGFDGLVLKMENGEIKTKETSNDFDVTVGSGIYLMKLILEMQKQGIGGLEWAAGIPATLGGAVCNNAGAHGKDISESIKSVQALEMNFNGQEKYLESCELQEMAKPDCNFSYRNSTFKETKNFVILDATLSLQKGDAEDIRKKIEENVKGRMEKQPLEYPNIGSIFKNPVLSEEAIGKLSVKCPVIESLVKNNTVPAGWFIEQAGLKGKRVGGAMVSEKHANFIINVGDARAEDVVILISLIKQKIRIKFDVQLHEEIEYVGF